MTDNMKRFLEAAELDSALAEAIEGTDEPEKLLALAAEKGFALTAEDLAPEESFGELDDEALDDVAGGGVVQDRYASLLSRFSPWMPQKSGLSLRKDGPVGERAFQTGDGPVAERAFQTGVGTPVASGLPYFGGPGKTGGTILKEV